MTILSRRQILAGAAALVGAAASTRAFAQAPSGPFKLDPLPYPASKNEPHIDAQTMEIHHDRHHAAYVQQPQRASRRRTPQIGQHAAAGHPGEARRDAGIDPHRRCATTAAATPTTPCSGRSWAARAASRTGEVQAAIDRDLGGFAEVPGRLQRRRRPRLRLRLGVRHRRPRRQARARDASRTRTRR